MTVSACNISKKCSAALVWIEAMKDLDSRFQELSEAVAQAKTTEERHRLLALTWEIVRQAEEKLALLKRMKEAQGDRLYSSFGKPLAMHLYFQTVCLLL